MTTTDFSRRLSEWLHEDSEHRVPDHLDEVLVMTAATRQRAWWSSPGRWLFMDTTFAGRAAPGLPVFRLIGVAVLVLALVGLGLVAIGSRQQRLPAPFGPAANGVILYAAAGDIYAVDPDGQNARVIVGGPENDVAVLASRDGTQLLIARELSGSRFDLFAASIDGSGVRPMSPTPILGLKWADWSPDGSSLAVVDGSGRASIVSARGGAPREINLPGLEAEEIYWRPNGEELVFLGRTSGSSRAPGFYAVRSDGTGFRVIAELPYNDGAHATALSPDGKRVMFTQWDGDQYPGGHLYAVDVDSGEKQLLEFDGDPVDYYGAWSPDGTRIVFVQGSEQDRAFVAVGPAEGGHATRIGKLRPWGIVAEPAFSPDGEMVIEQYSGGQTWIYGASDGSAYLLHASIPTEPSWQRLAP